VTDTEGVGSSGWRGGVGVHQGLSRRSACGVARIGGQAPASARRRSRIPVLSQWPPAEHQPCRVVALQASGQALAIPWNCGDSDWCDLV